MSVASIEVVHWNPRKLRIPKTQLKIGPKKNNFGDLLGPIIVQRVVENRGLAQTASERRRDGSHKRQRRLLAVGSIMHMAREGDVVWGTGVNGKVLESEHAFKRLDVRAVRGPLTARWLEENKNLQVPRTFGDPGLLIGYLWPELRNRPKTRKMTIIPNLNEVKKFEKHPNFISPVAPLMQVLEAIGSSEFVVGSSLHAMVIADSLGVPSALLASGSEPAFKYTDYFLGTGRPGYEPHQELQHAIDHALSLGRCSSYEPLGCWDPSALLASFPTDLWS